MIWTLLSVGGVIGDLDFIVFAKLEEHYCAGEPMWFPPDHILPDRDGKPSTDGKHLPKALT